MHGVGRWYLLLPVPTSSYSVGTIPGFGTYCPTPHMVFVVLGRWGAPGGASARETARSGAVGGVQPRGEGAGVRRRTHGGVYTDVCAHE